MLGRDVDGRSTPDHSGSAWCSSATRITKRDPTAERRPRSPDQRSSGSYSVPFASAPSDLQKRVREGNSVRTPEPARSSFAQPTNEPGQTFVLVGEDGRVLCVRDYGVMEHGGAMYVPPDELVPQVADKLGPG